MKKSIFILFVILFLTPAFILAADKIEINTASLAQLDQLTGVGPVLGQRIIDARPFSSVDDLLRVKGIGPSTLQKIKDQGLAYVSGHDEATTAPATAEKIEVVNNTTLNQTPAQEPIGAINQAVEAVSYPTGVFINEILPNPAGADETDEWIELYNSNNSEIALSGWKIQDTVGTATTYTIPKNTIILANSFLIFKRPDTKIMLNNDQDGLNLLTPDNKIIDSVSFTSAPLGQSYIKTLSGWQWSTTLTPGAKNVIAVAATLPKQKNSDKNDGVDARLAAISLPAQSDQNINTNQEQNIEKNPWFLFFTVLAATIILAIIVLFIKFKFFKNHVRT